VHRRAAREADDRGIERVVGRRDQHLVDWKSTEWVGNDVNISFTVRLVAAS